MFDASVRFTWFVILAFNIAIVAIIIITFAAAGILSTARVTVAVNGALFTLVTLVALPYVSMMRIHVERVTAAGTKADATHAPYGNEGAGAESDPWRNRRVRLVSHRLPWLCREEHELRVSDITDITVGDSNREVDRRKTCCHDVVYAHTRATGAIPWRFPVYVGNDADEQAELWLNYLGLPPRGTV